VRRILNRIENEMPGRLVQIDPVKRFYFRGRAGQ